MNSKILILLICCIFFSCSKKQHKIVKEEKKEVILKQTVLEAFPGYYNFGQVGLATNHYFEFEIKNLGKNQSNPITVSMEQGAHFLINSNDCVKLDVNQNCKVRINFNPVKIGKIEDKLILDDGLNKSEVTLTGYGDNYLANKPMAITTNHKISMNSKFINKVNGNDRFGYGLTYKIVNKVQNGNLVLNEDTGTFEYQPKKDYLGYDYFTFMIMNETGMSSDIGMVLLQVDKQNDDSRLEGFEKNYKITKNTPYRDKIETNGVNPLIEITGYPKGKLTLDNRNFEYVPPKDFVGQDIISFKAYENNKYSDIYSITFTISEPEKTDKQRTPASQK
jgi:Bacterial Ig domain